MTPCPKASARKPFSEESPGNMAMYLYELIQAASTLMRENHLWNGTHPSGFTALMDVIEERACALGLLLDAPAFTSDWPQPDADLTRAGKL